MLPSPSQLRPSDHALSPRYPRADLRLVPKTRRVAVILNANAKKVNRSVLERFQQVVPAADLFYSESLEQAQEHAQTILSQRYNAVMVGGGDGTVTSTMNLLLDAQRKMARGPSMRALPDLGVLKLGTGNALGHLTGCADPIQDLTQALSDEDIRARPLRLIEDAKTGWVCPFASMGYDARVLNDYIDLVNGTKTKMSKMMAKSLAGYFYAIYTKTVPAEFGQEQPHLRVVSTGRCSVIDPQTQEEIALSPGATLFEGTARAIALGSTPFYGFGLKSLPFARRRNDRFHVRVSQAPISYLLSHLPSLWKGELHKYMFDFLVEGVRIECSRELPMQFAGDARGYAKECEFRLAEQAFRLLDGTGNPAE